MALAGRTCCISPLFPSERMALRAQGAQQDGPGRHCLPRHRHRHRRLRPQPSSGEGGPPPSGPSAKRERAGAPPCARALHLALGAAELLGVQEPTAPWAEPVPASESTPAAARQGRRTCLYKVESGSSTSSQGSGSSRLHAFPLRERPALAAPLRRPPRPGGGRRSGFARSKAAPKNRVPESRDQAGCAAALTRRLPESSLSPPPPIDRPPAHSPADLAVRRLTRVIGKAGPRLRMLAGRRRRHRRRWRNRRLRRLLQRRGGWGAVGAAISPSPSLSRSGQIRPCNGRCEFADSKNPCKMFSEDAMQSIAKNFSH